MKYFVLTVLGGLLCSAATSMPPQEGPTSDSKLLPIPRANVEVRGTGENETIDASANRVRVSALLRQVALQSHRELVGLRELTRDPEVTVGLDAAVLRDALRWIGGSVGLRVQLTTTQIRVSEDLTTYPTREELYGRASTGYFRALVDHPQSDYAAGAMWNRARIEAERSDRQLEAARAFDELVEAHPDSSLVPEALLEAGKLFGTAGQWEEAVVRFDRLAGLTREHEHSFTARRLLSDAHTRVAELSTNPAVRRENAQRALYVVDALDDANPTQDPTERKRRYMVRGRAYSLADRPVEAMKCLDLAAQYSPSRDRDPEVARLRALSLESAGRLTDASKAWLYLASLVDGADRIDAYRDAARTANEAREYTTTLAIEEAAKKEGVGDHLAPAADAARTALGMEPYRVDLFGDPERISRAQRLADRGLHEEVIRALRPVFDRRTSLDEGERTRLGRTYADALARLDRVDDARVVLRKVATEATSADTRRALYLFASELLERDGRLEEAIAALEGRL